MDWPQYIALVMTAFLWAYAMWAHWRIYKLEERIDQLEDRICVLISKLNVHACTPKAHPTTAQP